jgi:hypothetical protein
MVMPDRAVLSSAKLFYMPWKLLALKRNGTITDWLL